MPRKLDGVLFGLAEPADAENGADGEPRGAHQHIVLRHHQILEHRHALEQPDVLEGAGDAGVAIDIVVVEPLQVEALTAGMGELHQTFGRLVEAGDAIEHRGLAGAVRPDQRSDVVAAHRERNVVDGEQPTEAHGQVLDLEQGRGLPRLHALPSSTRSLGIGLAFSSAIEGVRVPTMPRGRQTMIPTMATPNSSMR